MIPCAPRSTDRGAQSLRARSRLPAVTNQRLRLSVGAPAGQRAVAAVVGGLFTAVGVAFVLLPVLAEGLLRRMTGFGDPLPSYEEARDLPPGMLPPDLAGTSSSGPTPVRFVGLCGLPFVLLGLYLVLRVLRTAAWLAGTRASVRGALGTRTVDLATAEVTAGAASDHPVLPAFPEGRYLKFLLFDV